MGVATNMLAEQIRAPRIRAELNDRVHGDKSGGWNHTRHDGDQHQTTTDSHGRGQHGGQKTDADQRHRPERRDRVGQDVWEKRGQSVQIHDLTGVNRDRLQISFRAVARRTFPSSQAPSG